MHMHVHVHAHMHMRTRMLMFIQYFTLSALSTVMKTDGLQGSDVGLMARASSFIPISSKICRPGTGLRIELMGVLRGGGSTGAKSVNRGVQRGKHRGCPVPVMED